MSYNFSELKAEVKRRATRDQGGTQFDTSISNIINTSLFRIARECPWKQLRRKTTFATFANYTTGTGGVTATNGSNSFTVSGGSLLTDGITIGQRVRIGSSTQRYIIQSITSNSAFTTNLNFDGTTTSTASLLIYGKEEYNLPIETGRIGVIWHEAYGYPIKMEYITDSEFYGQNVVIENQRIPVYYRMWTDNWVISQPASASVVTISSSSSADVSKNITVYGTVSGYPDYEVITTNGSNGTTTVSGSKSFSMIERISKDATTTGRITVTTNSALVTVAVLPVGYSTNGIQYKKIQLWPLPTTVFNINVQYYKDPWALVNDTDIHELGHEFDEALILLATSKIKFQENQDEGAAFFKLYQDELQVLRRMNMDRNLDWQPALQRPSAKRGNRGFANRNLSFEQLGGQYGPLTR